MLESKYIMNPPVCLENCLVEKLCHGKKILLALKIGILCKGNWINDIKNITTIVVLLINPF